MKGKYCKNNILGRDQCPTWSKCIFDQLMHKHILGYAKVAWTHTLVKYTLVLSTKKDNINRFMASKCTYSPSFFLVNSNVLIMEFKLRQYTKMISYGVTTKSIDECSHDIPHLYLDCKWHTHDAPPTYKSIFLPMTTLRSL